MTQSVSILKANGNYFSKKIFVVIYVVSRKDLSVSYERFETEKRARVNAKFTSTKNVLLEAVSGLADTEYESSQIDAEIFFLFIFYIRVHFYILNFA